MTSAKIQPTVVTFAGRGERTRSRSTGSPRGRRSADAGQRGCAPPLRLTRRGRIVVRLVVLAAVAALVTASLLMSPLSAIAGGRGAALPVTYRTVLPGETLWQIAAEVAPHADPRDTIAQIVELNALDTVRIEPGQRLAVPPRS